MKKIIYMVTYSDDKGQKHITFVEGFSAVRFLEERFYNIEYEIIAQHTESTPSFLSVG